MADTGQLVRRTEQKPRDARPNRVVLAANTLNLTRFNRTVYIVHAKHPRKNRQEVQQTELKPTKLVDTPATTVTVVPRKKAIRKVSNEDMTYRKPAPRKPVSIRAKKSAN